ncbi:sensor histidine kinase [Vibrio rotiferianus]|uniref:sensor histidine kinase n=1 Tax=Vibrio rotiferianus TaxID=190895 RepID=UPI000237764C|nr:cache domain-containing protein [Vibrio rotiferianus]
MPFANMALKTSELAVNILNPKAIRHFVLLISAVGLVGLLLTHYYATQYQQRQWQSLLATLANQVSQKIDAELAKFEQIPNVLSHDPRLLSALKNQEPSSSLNQLLSDWLKQSLADTIYVHDRTGTVIASSNFVQADSFVGADFSFRPYFQNAMKGEKAQYVALGARSNKRGYFFASPLIADGNVLGVITVKVNLEQLEQSLAQESTDILVVDEHNIVFMSNLPNWRYKALFPLTESQTSYLTRTQQYGDQLPQYRGDITQEGDSTDFEHSSLLSSEHYLAFAEPLHAKGYRVIAIVTKNQILMAALQADIIFLIFYSLMSLIALAWFQMMVNKARLAEMNVSLEEKVTQRTVVLSQANQQLQQTISQYQLSQKELKQTQQELTQAAKLALLGELSASINHEINQPLAALRTYTENSQRLMAMEQYPLVTANLAKMLSLNDTISEVIARLKVFTRKSDQNTHNEIANLHDSVHNATSILSNKLIKQGVTLKVPTIHRNISLAIHSVELEQVLINLFHNAAQAMDGQRIDPQISLAVQCHDNLCDILISDNGPGMSDSSLEKVFDPFFTTKPEGLGLGLTISKRILESYGGSLTAFNHANKSTHELAGMTFVITVPLVTEPTEQPHE